MIISHYEVMSEMMVIVIHWIRWLLYYKTLFKVSLDKMMGQVKKQKLLCLINIIAKAHDQILVHFEFMANPNSQNNREKLQYLA